MVMVIGDFFDDDGNGSDLYEAGSENIKLVLIKRAIKRSCGSYPHPQPICTYSSSFVITLILLGIHNEHCILLLCRVQGAGVGVKNETQDCKI